MRKLVRVRVKKVEPPVKLVETKRYARGTSCCGLAEVTNGEGLAWAEGLGSQLQKGLVPIAKLRQARQLLDWAWDEGYGMIMATSASDQPKLYTNWLRSAGFRPVGKRGFFNVKSGNTVRIWLRKIPKS